MGPPMRTPVALAPASPPRGASTVALVAVRTPKRCAPAPAQPIPPRALTSLDVSRSLLEEVGSAMSVTPARRSVRRAGDAPRSPAAALATAGYAFLPNAALAGTSVADSPARASWASPALAAPGSGGRGASPAALAAVSLPWATPTPAQSRLAASLAATAPATAPSKLQRALAAAEALAAECDADAAAWRSPPRTVGAKPRASNVSPAPSPLVSALYDSEAGDDVASLAADSDFFEDDGDSFDIDVSYAAVSPVPTPDQTALIPHLNPLAMRAAQQAGPSPLTAALTQRPMSPMDTPMPMVLSPVALAAASPSPLGLLSPVEAAPPALLATPVMQQQMQSPRRVTIAGGASPLAGGASPVSEALAALLADAAATPAPTPRAPTPQRAATPAAMTPIALASPLTANTPGAATPVVEPAAAAETGDSPMGVFVRVMAGMLNAAIEERSAAETEAAAGDITEVVPSAAEAEAEAEPAADVTAVIEAQAAAQPESPAVVLAAAASPHVTPRSEPRRASLSARKAAAELAELAEPDAAAPVSPAMPDDEGMPSITPLDDAAFADVAELSPPAAKAAEVTPRSAARRRSMAARKSFAPEEVENEAADVAAEEVAAPIEAAAELEAAPVQEEAAVAAPVVAEEAAVEAVEAAPKRGRGRKAAPPAADVAPAVVEEAAPVKRATRGRAAAAPPADVPVAAEAAPPKRGRGKAAAAAAAPEAAAEEAPVKPAGRASRAKAAAPAPVEPAAEVEAPAPRARRAAKAAPPEPAAAEEEAAPRRSTRSRK